MSVRRGKTQSLPSNFPQADAAANEVSVRRESTRGYGIYRDIADAAANEVSVRRQQSCALANPRFFLADAAANEVSVRRQTSLLQQFSHCGPTPPRTK